MALIDRLQLLLKSEWNARTTRSSGPEAMRLVGDARSELARSVDAERKLRRAYQDALDEVERAEQQAMEAVRRGDDGAARRALLDKRRHELEAEHLQRQLHLHQHQLVQLQQAVDALQRRLQGGSSGQADAPSSPPWAAGEAPPSVSRSSASRFERVGDSAARPPYGHPRSEWVRSATPTSDDDRLSGEAFERFDAFAQRIEDTEARLEADALLTASMGTSAAVSRPDASGEEDPLADPLEARFRRLEFDAWKREQGGGGPEEDAEPDGGDRRV